MQLKNKFFKNWNTMKINDKTKIYDTFFKNDYDFSNMS